MAKRDLSYNNHTFGISYEIINPSNSKDILFLHGWGSNKEIMMGAFKSSFKDYRLIFVDMPGFGKSTTPITLSTNDYALINKLFLKELNSNPAIIFGHSFGGKVATLLNPPTLCLLSSAGILVPKPLKVRVKIKLFKLLKPFGAGKIRTLFASKDVEGMSEVMYETFKNVVDEDFSDDFANFKNKALLFWGKNDTATPLWTAEKIASLISNSKLFPFDGDHYFFMQHPKAIEEITLQEIKDLDV